MRVYLMQHGEAVDKATNPDRPLSAQGRRDVERVAAFAAAAGVRAKEVWCSDKTRSRETAELLAARTGGIARKRDGLSPGDDVSDVLAWIERADCDVAIAGHLPHLSLLAAAMLHTKGKREPIAFQRGGIVAFERDGDGAFRVCWMIVPEMLRAP